MDNLNRLSRSSRLPFSYTRSTYENPNHRKSYDAGRRYSLAPGYAHYGSPAAGQDQPHLRNKTIINKMINISNKAKREK